MAKKKDNTLTWGEESLIQIVERARRAADERYDQEATKELFEWLKKWEHTEIGEAIKNIMRDHLGQRRQRRPRGPAFDKGSIVVTVVILEKIGTATPTAKKQVFAGATLESGTVKLRGNTEIDWYLWSGDPPRHHPTPRNGSISVLYRDELYNNQNHHNIYRMFGISENEVRRNLWLVVRPPELDRQAKSGVYPRAARDTLQWFGGRELPLSDWGQQFADQLPTPIVHALRKARGERSGSIDDNAWKEHPASAGAPLRKVPRHRPDPESPKQAGRATITELFPIAPPPRPVPPRPPPAAAPAQAGRPVEQTKVHAVWAGR